LLAYEEEKEQPLKLSLGQPWVWSISVDFGGRQWYKALATSFS